MTTLEQNTGNEVQCLRGTVDDQNQSREPNARQWDLAEQ
jgi:hypothetical protein